MKKLAVASNVNLLKFRKVKIFAVVILLALSLFMGICGCGNSNEETQQPVERCTVRFYVYLGGWTYYDRKVDSGKYLHDVYNIPYGTTGLVFINWYLDRHYEMIWNPTTQITTDIVLYAKYKNFNSICPYY